MENKINTEKNSASNDINSNNEQLNNNKINDDETERLKEDTQRKYYSYFYSQFNGKKPQLRPELKKLQKEVLNYGSDIIDGEDKKKYENRPALEILGHKLYNIMAIIEHYFHAILSIIVAIYIIYYTNLFYNLYFNPKIDKYYLYCSAFLFILYTLIFMYIYLYLPYIQKLDEASVEKQFDEVVPYCTIIMIIAFVTLIISMWGVYRYYSIPIVLLVFWGFIMSSNFIGFKFIGNICFIGIIILMLFSYKFIPGPGKTYYT